MNEQILENNRVSLTGVISGGFTHAHDVFGEAFYMMDIRVQRKGSIAYDIIPIMVSERLIDITQDYTGVYAGITGQYRSYNKFGEYRNRLVLSVFAREVELPEMDAEKDINEIYLNGFICKPPVYRVTPLGREIADVLLAVNRPYGKSDYIPCICWGRNARFADSLEVGANVRVMGRIQSREYQKKIGEDEFEMRTAYEASVSKIERGQAG